MFWLFARNAWQRVPKIHFQGIIAQAKKTAGRDSGLMARSQKMIILGDMAINSVR